VSAALVLYRFALRRERRLLLSLIGLLFLLELLIVSAARAVDAGGGFAVLAGLVPDFVRRMMGFDVALLLSFRGVVSLGFFHPATTATLVAGAIVAARGAVAEIESRTVELIVARPVPRWSLVARSLALGATTAALLPAGLVAGLLTGLLVNGRLGQLPLAPYLRLAVQDALLVLALTAVFALFASLARRTRGYTQAAVGFAVASYVLDFLANVWAPVRRLGPLSLFRHAGAAPALTGAPPTMDLVILAAVALAAGGAALAIYQRRDL
jgi:ABC-2 type transport system permease protein